MDKEGKVYGFGHLTSSIASVSDTIKKNSMWDKSKQTQERLQKSSTLDDKGRDVEWKYQVPDGMLPGFNKRSKEHLQSMGQKKRRNGRRSADAISNNKEEEEEEEDDDSLVTISDDESEAQSRVDINNEESSVVSSMGGFITQSREMRGDTRYTTSDYKHHGYAFLKTTWSQSLSLTSLTTIKPVDFIPNRSHRFCTKADEEYFETMEEEEERKTHLRLLNTLGLSEMELAYVLQIVPPSAPYLIQPVNDAYWNEVRRNQRKEARRNELREEREKKRVFKAKKMQMTLMNQRLIREGDISMSKIASHFSRKALIQGRRVHREQEERKKRREEEKLPQHILKTRLYLASKGKKRDSVGNYLFQGMKKGREEGKREEGKEEKKEDQEEEEKDNMYRVLKVSEISSPSKKESEGEAPRRRNADYLDEKYKQAIEDERERRKKEEEEEKEQEKADLMVMLDQVKQQLYSKQEEEKRSIRRTARRSAFVDSSEILPFQKGEEWVEQSSEEERNARRGLRGEFSGKHEMHVANATVEMAMDRLRLPYSSPTYPSRMQSFDSEDLPSPMAWMSAPTPPLPPLPSPSITLQALYPKSQEQDSDEDEVAFMEEKEEVKESAGKSSNESKVAWLYP